MSKNEIDGSSADEKEKENFSRELWFFVVNKISELYNHNFFSNENIEKIIRLWRKY